MATGRRTMRQRSCYRARAASVTAPTVRLSTYGAVPKPGSTYGRNRNLAETTLAENKTGPNVIFEAVSAPQTKPKFSRPLTAETHTDICTTTSRTKTMCRKTDGHDIRQPRTSKTNRRQTPYNYNALSPSDQEYLQTSDGIVAESRYLTLVQ